MIKYIISNTIEDGHRVQTCKEVFDKSDDLFSLANITKQYENILVQIAAATDPTRIAALEADKERVETLIAQTQINVDMYNENK